TELPFFAPTLRLFQNPSLNQSHSPFPPALRIARFFRPVYFESCQNTAWKKCILNRFPETNYSGLGGEDADQVRNSPVRQNRHRPASRETYGKALPRAT